jgi:hypothetical protein
VNLEDHPRTFDIAGLQPDGLRDAQASSVSSVRIFRSGTLLSRRATSSRERIAGKRSALRVSTA